jgi:hypothetical protein
MIVLYVVAFCGWLLCLFCSIPFPSSELCERKELLASFALSFNAAKQGDKNTVPVLGREECETTLQERKASSYRDTLVCCFDYITVKMQMGCKMHEKTH